MSLIKKQPQSTKKNIQGHPTEEGGPPFYDPNQRFSDLDPMPRRVIWTDKRASSRSAQWKLSAWAMAVLGVASLVLLSQLPR